jgi:predicted transposase YbfD/YdcC
MQYNTVQIEIQVPFSEDGYVFDVGSLYDRFQRLTDRRRARGKRFELAQVLVLFVLAKLAGEDQPSGIAEWVRARQAVLGAMLSIARRSLPSHSTYRRVLHGAVELSELQSQIREFLGQIGDAGQSVLISLDGKTLRGSIPADRTSGIHLLAAYVPHEGMVLAQVAVRAKANEIAAAPQVLRALDLRGKIVMGDALLTQRNLSVQIVEGGAEYIWLAKDNQPTLQQEITDVFLPDEPFPGSSPIPDDFEVARTVTKGHGRLEERTLTTSSLLQGYTDWPYLQQVFKLQRRVVHLKTGQVQQEVVYGLTSLTRAEVGPTQLLTFVRDYWGIENGLHYRRDKTLHEDATRMTQPRLAEAMAILNNLVIGLALRTGCHNLAAARRHYAACLPDALGLVLRCPARL